MHAAVRPIHLTLVAMWMLATASRGLLRSAEEKLWVHRLLEVPRQGPAGEEGPSLMLLRQDFERLQRNKSILGTPILIGNRAFPRGLGTHSVSHIRLTSPIPLEKFSACVGVDSNDRTRGGQGSVAFSVAADGKGLHRTGILREGQGPEKIDVALGGAKVLDLHASDGDDGPACDHADWAEATVTLAGGRTIRLDEIPLRASDPPPRHPFSFRCGGKSSDDCLESWRKDGKVEETLEGGRRTVTTWTDAATGLVLRWESCAMPDFPAAEWILHLENAGKADTPIVEDLLALDVGLQDPLPGGAPYVLHRTNGAPANPTDFEVEELAVGPKSPRTLGGGGGRSSNKDFPFFRVDTGSGAIIIAVGWSGQWKARTECAGGEELRLTAGLEKTRFTLHPGERVRTPRILIFEWRGERPEANARFRELIYKHYAARRAGKEPLPILFSNTCFTRGGGWLNECNAENQISLIRAYAPLGLEAVITDAGWFEGGWPAGAGNWNPRRDAYPLGMRPVAAAASERGMVYGLWFEPERVVAGTWIHKNRPEWILSDGSPSPSTHLLDMGRREARDYLLGIVKGFMDLPGFRVYRQDFNMDPLPYWRASDAPDRQGMTEMKYIEGLYEFWDGIAAAWPDSIREECASGGRRIDLETIRRMHIHQESDYWFDDDVDQAQIWSLSQYLPGNLFTTPIVRLDDYTFHSTFATSLCVGWIADDPAFDAARGKKLLDRYLELRHLLVGAWYPLLPYSRDPGDWMASQYHRADLENGLILVFRRGESPYRTAEVSLRGLEPGATYELAFDVAGTKRTATGAELMARYAITLPEPRRSELIVYSRATPDAR